MPNKSIVAFAVLVAASPLLAKDLVLTLATPAKPIHVGDYVPFAITISNRGPKSVTLVEPGDGSDCAWRTPVVGWSMLPADAQKQKHPASCPPFQGARGCGNINALKLNEVFSLKPGTSRRFESWIGHPPFDKPGRFRLVFYYQNKPDLGVSGLPLRAHEDGVLARIKKSTPCRLVSEEIFVDVLPKLP